MDRYSATKWAHLLRRRCRDLFWRPSLVRSLKRPSLGRRHALNIASILIVLVMASAAVAQPVPDAAPVKPVNSAPIAEPGTPPPAAPAPPAPEVDKASPPSPTAQEAPATDDRFGQRTIGRTEDDLLLFQVSIGDILVAQDLPGFPSGASIVLPLGEYMEVLDFPITVDIAEGRAEGWFISENRFFALNVKEGTVLLDGKRTEFDRAMVEIHNNDIYVDIRILPQWFPIDYSFDLANLTLKLKPREKLPVQKKAERDGYRQQLSRRPTKTTRDLPKVESEPRLISWPVADIDLSSVFAKSGAATSTVQNTYSAQIAGELAFSSFEAFVSGTEKNNLSDLRVKLNRKDPGGKALGKAFAEKTSVPITDFSVGDINPAQIPLISRSRLGRGIQFSNAPLNSRTEFDRITLEGDIALSWEIELYRNEILVDFREAATETRYKFEDVPLLFGRNVLKLVFYGPQGQTKEEIQTINVGNDQTPTGTVEYRFAANEHDRRVLTRLENPDNDFEGRNRVVGEIKYGLSPKVSLVGSFAHVPIRTDSVSRPFTYVGGGLRYGFENLIGRIDFVSQLDGGWASKFAGQSKLFGVSASAEHDIYRRFISEQVSLNGGRTLISKTKLRLNGTIPQTFLPRLPLSADGTYERRRDGSSKVVINSRMSAALGRFNVSNSSALTWNFEPDSGNTTTSDSTLLVNGRFNKWRIRGQGSYSTVPRIKLNSYNVTADLRLSERYQPRLGFSRSFGDSRVNTFTAGMNLKYPFVLLGFNTTYQSNGQINARVNTSFSASRDPNSGRVGLSSEDAGNGGMAAVLVFLDKDLNGKFSEGDTPLEDVAFRFGGGGLIQGKTNAQGALLITNLPAYQETSILVDLGSLEDPFWQTDPEGISLVPRPGTMVNYQFPVVSAGEADGTVWAIQEGKPDPIPVSRITIELVDTNGTVVRSERSAHDGFFLLDFIKPGKYTVRVGPEDLKKIKYTVDTEHEIEITGEGTIVNGLDFTLTAIKKPDASTGQKPSENSTQEPPNKPAEKPANQ